MSEKPPIQQATIREIYRIIEINGVSFAEVVSDSYLPGLFRIEKFELSKKTNIRNNKRTKIKDFEKSVIKITRPFESISWG